MRDNGKAFIDSNVFIYAYSGTEEKKQKTAQENIEKYDCVINTQVLNEFCNVCIKKFYKDIDEIKTAINEILDGCSVSYIEIEDISQAIHLHQKYGYGYWDCLMLASAIKSGCKYIFTEDMQDGQLIENNLVIKNIFSKVK